MHDKTHRPRGVYNFAENKGVFHERPSMAFVTSRPASFHSDPPRPVRARAGRPPADPHIDDSPSAGGGRHRGRAGAGPAGRGRGGAVFGGRQRRVSHVVR